MPHPPTLVPLHELWFTRCPVPTATGIAADRGAFDAEFSGDGIQVRSFQDRPANGYREEHFTHAHRTLIREGGNVPALWARSTGADTRLIGLTWIEERQAILVRAGDGPTTPEQLRGQRLAIPRHPVPIDFWRAMALKGFAGALAAAGLDLTDAHPVDVPADGRHRGQWETELAALARGKVDAVYVKGALAVESARRHGVAVGIELDDLPDPRSRINNGTPRPITVAGWLLDERPDLVDRFLAVLIEAADWAAGHPTEVARILSAETGAGTTGVAGAYRAGQHRTLHPDLSPERRTLLAEQERFLRDHGFLAASVDVRGWADPEPLRRAHELVTRRRQTPATPVPPPATPGDRTGD
ncbi:ABC transporter substrate-binding protein [Micromonospora sp. CPCC 206060]|uniref:ABC transporter substrate-binding protein n=1 Tax=Micromonospora sp. CPCC 206060 TaxID=3122406 RepID=UPI002FEF56DF